MSKILHIETATAVCSVALSVDNKVVFNRENFQGQSHASSLGVFVEEAMVFVRQQQWKLDAVAVSSGPGSYTGLRIGVSEAKGLSYGINIPLIAIPTHEIMAYQMKNRVGESSLLCPMIDARRMEVYAAVYDQSLAVMRPVQADIVDENSYAEILKDHTVYFFGNGANKCREHLISPNAHFVDDIHPLASAMAELAQSYFDNQQFVDVAYFEPFYLKDFVATQAKNKILDI